MREQEIRWSALEQALGRSDTRAVTEADTRAELGRRVVRTDG